jgi:hypothetical protein
MRLRRNKYHAQPVEIDGLKFASKKEARRYADLKLLQRAGEVRSFAVHPWYPLLVDGQIVGRMTLDFEVIWANGEVTFEDTKSRPTATSEAYRLRRKILEACHPHIRVTEL